MSSIGFLIAPLALLGEMEAEGSTLLEQSGVSPAQIWHQHTADIRYVGQGHEIQVRLAGDWIARVSPTLYARSGWRW